MTRGRVCSALFALASAAACLGAHGELPDPTRYEVKIGGPEGRQIDVAVRLPESPGQLAVYPNGAPFARGWAHYMGDLEIVDATGQPLAVTGQGPTWTLAEPSATTSTLRYSVELDHDRTAEWPAGVHEAAYGYAGGVVAVGRALFVVGEHARGPMRVRFEIPQGWRLATPWTPLGELEYVVPTPDALHNAVIVAGDFESVGDESLHVVALGSMRSSARVIASTLEPIRMGFATAFGSPGAADRLLVILSRNESDPAWRGGVFNQSISLAWPAPPSGDNAADWVPTLAHELFHMWNGPASLLSGTAEEWFKEGFAAYFAAVGSGRAGILTDREVLDEWSLWLGRYKRHRGSSNLIRAGNAKGRNFGLLYGGGLAIALSLDVGIRRHTNGSLSLDDLLTRLLATAGRQQVSLQSTAIVATVAELGGAQLGKALAGWLEDGRSIPLDETLAELGLVATPNSTGLELSGVGNELLQAILRPPAQQHP